MRPSRRRQRATTKLSLEKLEPRTLLAIDLTVAPFDHTHEHVGGGAGFTLYSGHLVNGTPASQRPEVYDWLFADLNMPELRIFSFRGEANGNDNSDPFDLDLAGMDIPTRDNEFLIYQEALARNPRTKVMAYANTHPDFLKNADGSYNVNFPNFYQELAEYWYGNLVITKQRYGVDIDIVDILNEPDLNPEISRDLALDIMANSVSALREIVDLHFDTYAIPMPQISGFSNLTTGGAVGWLTEARNNRQEAWDNIDILTTHPYGGGGSGFNFNNYAAIAQLRDADHPRFVQNEMEFGHSSFLNNENSLPNDLADDDLEAALALGHAFATAVDAGANGFHVFQGVNPNSQGGKSLVHTVWGQEAVRRKGYYVYQQLSSFQPIDADVVRDLTTGAPTGVETVAYNAWGDNRVYVNVVNATANDETVTLRFEDNDGSPLNFTRIVDYATDAAHNAGMLDDTLLSSPQTEWTTQVEANSVRTFVVDLTTVGFAVPVGDMTYVRNTNFQSINVTPQDDDASPRNEILVGRVAGNPRGLVEFHLSQLPIESGATIASASLEMRAYRGNVASNESIQFELYAYPNEFNEATATWVDPDGDGDPSSGDSVPGGTLGGRLTTSSLFSGSSNDFNADGADEIFHQRVTLPSSESFRQVIEASLEGDIRFAIEASQEGTTSGEFFGFFDETTDWAPYLVVTVNESSLLGPAVSSIEFDHEQSHRIDVIFDREIGLDTLQASDFVVRNQTTGQVIPSSEFTLGNVTSTSATIFFVLSFPLSDGNWELLMPAGVVEDTMGQANPTSQGFEFFVLSGDADRDKVVSIADYTIWRDTLGSDSDLRANHAVAGASTGIVDDADFDAWKANFGEQLATDPPLVELGATLVEVVDPADPIDLIEPTGLDHVVWARFLRYEQEPIDGSVAQADTSSLNPDARSVIREEALLAYLNARQQRDHAPPKRTPSATVSDVARAKNSLPEGLPRVRNAVRLPMRQ